jgi:hypothetical protein
MSQLAINVAAGIMEMSHEIATLKAQIEAMKKQNEAQKVVQKAAYSKVYQCFRTQRGMWTPDYNKMLYALQELGPLCNHSFAKPAAKTTA